MKAKIQIKSIWGSLLFELEKEDNSIKKTLHEAVKQRADLRGADLRGADLRGADLRGADLQGADLRGADLRGADLREAYLRGADLREAVLQGADLRGAVLQGADLQGADLREAYLRGAVLQGIYNQNCILPEGELIIWKKLKDNIIAKLLIPTDAKRVHCIGSRKCRFSYVKTIALYNGSSEKCLPKKTVGIGQHDENIKYIIGLETHPDKFDDSPLIECSNGIHGFITRQEAEDY